MNLFIVTVKLRLDVDHDPRNKKTGPCPVSGKPCTDVTGAHHSFIVSALDETAARRLTEDNGFSHITRIEEV